MYKDILACNPRCSRRRRIDEADISTPVAVDQHAANCLKEVVQSFIAMRSRCRSSTADVTFCRPLLRVVRCSEPEYLETQFEDHCSRAVLKQSSI
ncbi:UNVERIFIED_CONTAM: hypothetical protein NCL1_48281 [Trichonephila clavipes]